MIYIHKGKLIDGIEKARGLYQNSMVTGARRVEGLWLIRVVEVQYGDS